MNTQSNFSLKLFAVLNIVLFLVMLNVPTVILAPEEIFGFPDVLRESAEIALTRLNTNVDIIRPMYYMLAWSAILTIPLAVLLHFLLQKRGQVSPLLNMATLSGIIAGVVQVLGYIRWSFMKPALAERYFDPNATAAQREAAELIYHAFNEYAGIGIGEHLGFVFNAVWLLLLCLYIARQQSFGRILSPWFGWSGVTLAALVLLSTVEQFGYEPPIIEWAFFIGYGGFVFWLLLLIFPLLRIQPELNAA